MSKTERSSFSIQLMSAAHIAQALRICRESGWNQLHEDWRRLIGHEPAGCFVAMCDGELVGTVTSTRYGSKLAWIGMMLVHPDFRRQGIATALMQRSIENLKNHQVGCMKLDATPAGEPVYRKLGFEVEWTFHRWSREGSTAITRTDLSDTATFAADSTWQSDRLDLDRRAFGADRREFLNLLTDGSHVHETRDGYGMLRPGFLASYLGPVSAKTPASAESIIAGLCDRSDRTIFWDIPGPNTEATQIARSLGFEPVRDLTRMWHGDECSPANLHWQYALADPGTG